MATPVGNSVPLTGDPILDGLLWGGKWIFSGSPTFTYSLNYTGYETGAWTSLSAAAAEQALNAWAAVANIQFVRTDSGYYAWDSNADLAVGLTGFVLSLGGAEALAVPPDPTFANGILPYYGFTRNTYPRPEGDLFFDDSSSDFLYIYPGGRGFEVGLHEIGHALGLKHPFDDGPGGRPTFEQLGINSLDNRLFTVMSYTDFSPYQSYGHAATPMVLDILAIQHLYGENYSYRTADDTYVLSDDGMMRTVWDAGGIDTFTAAGMASTVNIDLEEGGYSAHGSRYSITAIAFGVTIENAIGGSGGDEIVGNSTANRLTGGAGNDQIEGGGGNDIINGGTGIDSAAFSAPLHQHIITANRDGSYRVSGSLDGLDTVSGIEQLQFSDQLVDLATFTGLNQGESVFRFFNLGNGTHFYTADTAEAESVMATLPEYFFEGAAFDRNTLGGADAIDVHRFYNVVTHAHFYSADPNEIAYVRANLPEYSYDGVAYQAHSTESPGTTELYRFYNTVTNTHFYTADAQEAQHVLVDLAGLYSYDGVAYYVDVA